MNKTRNLLFMPKNPVGITKHDGSKIPTPINEPIVVRRLYDNSVQNVNSHLEENEATTSITKSDNLFTTSESLMPIRNIHSDVELHSFLSQNCPIELPTSNQWYLYNQQASINIKKDPSSHSTKKKLKLKRRNSSLGLKSIDLIPEKKDFSIKKKTIDVESHQPTPLMEPLISTTKYLSNECSQVLPSCSKAQSFTLANKCPSNCSCNPCLSSCASCLSVCPLKGSDYNRSIPFPEIYPSAECFQPSCCTNLTVESNCDKCNTYLDTSLTSQNSTHKWISKCKCLACEESCNMTGVQNILQTAASPNFCSASTTPTPCVAIIQTSQI